MNFFFINSFQESLFSPFPVFRIQYRINPPKKQGGICPVSQYRIPVSFRKHEKRDAGFPPRIAAPAGSFHRGASKSAFPLRPPDTPAPYRSSAATQDPGSRRRSLFPPDKKGGGIRGAGSRRRTPGCSSVRRRSPRRGKTRPPPDGNRPGDEPEAGEEGVRTIQEDFEKLYRLLQRSANC